MTTTFTPPELIETSSALYGKRLVREIRNHLISGKSVYYQGSEELSFNPRVYSVKFDNKRGVLVISRIAHLNVVGRLETYDVPPSQWAEGFCDSNGNTIYATRRLR